MPTIISDDMIERIEVDVLRDVADKVAIAA